MSTISELIAFIQDLYPTERPIPLHAPRFAGREKELVADCIDSTFVSSVGPYVTRFEEAFASVVGAGHAIAVVNGTQALYVALYAVGLGPGKEVITQSLTFAATVNAILYTGAKPVFVDVDRETLGMSPAALDTWLRANAAHSDGACINRATQREIAACVPMHTLGHPCRIAEIEEICREWNIVLVEDAAESLGSYVGERHTGTHGRMGAFSFNGNKIVTAGGGGMVVTDDPGLAARLKHLTTTAKVPHSWAFAHDEMGFNFRLPNINAALGLAQLEQLPHFLANKRETAGCYRAFFEGRRDLRFVSEPSGRQSNYWLNAVLAEDAGQRDALLCATNEAGVITRPLWTPMHCLPHLEDCDHGDLAQTEWLFERVVCMPSSVREPGAADA